MMYVPLIWLTLLLTTNQISKEQRRDHQGVSATGRRIIATSLRESINHHDFFLRPMTAIISQPNVIRLIAFFNLKPFSESPT